jgi:hypothetical protein
VHKKTNADFFSASVLKSIAQSLYKIIMEAKAKQYALKGYGIKNYQIFVLKFEVVFYIFKNYLYLSR